MVENRHPLELNFALEINLSVNDGYIDTWLNMIQDPYRDGHAAKANLSFSMGSESFTMVDAFPIAKKIPVSPVTFDSELQEILSELDEWLKDPYAFLEKKDKGLTKYL